MESQTRQLQRDDVNEVGSAQDSPWPNGPPQLLNKGMLCMDLSKHSLKAQATGCSDNNSAGDRNDSENQVCTFQGGWLKKGTLSRQGRRD